MKYTWIALAALLPLGMLTPNAGAQAMSESHDMKPGVPSHQLVVTANGKSTTLTMADLQAMPQRTLKVHNSHSNKDETYTGVGMSDLLAKFGFTLDGTGAQKIYRSYVKAEGTDKYFVLYSASELEPALSTFDSVLALTLDGNPIAADGEFKIVADGARKPARWVRNLSALTIVTLP